MKLDFSKALAAACAAALLAPLSASAHDSEYCEHTTVQGQSWLLSYYDYYTTRNYNANGNGDYWENHGHHVDHYLNRGNGWEYRHRYPFICGQTFHSGGGRLHESVDAGNVQVPATATPAYTVGAPADPVTVDPFSKYDSLVQPLVNCVPGNSGCTSPTRVAQAVTAAGFAVRWSYLTKMSWKSGYAPDAAPAGTCVVSVLTDTGALLAAVFNGRTYAGTEAPAVAPRAVKIEIATPAVARSLGHSCA
jgi:hypothetical protein